MSKDPVVKVVLLGDTGVGKSSIALRFVHSRFNAQSDATIGASFLSKTIRVNKMASQRGGRQTSDLLKVQIWDTAGQEKYHSLAPMYYRGAAAAVITFDITNSKSFETLKDWVDELMNYGPPNLHLCLAANKCDLAHLRKVDMEMAKEYAAEIGANFYETSAKEDVGVTTMFNVIAQQWWENNPLLAGGAGGSGLASRGQSTDSNDESGFRLRLSSSGVLFNRDNAAQESGSCC
eukprot:g1844.t1